MVVALATAGLILVLLCLGGAATCRPAWYTPVAIDHARLKTDKRELVDLMDAIGTALNTGRPIDFELREDQVNRWLAARSEMWPEVEDAGMRSLAHPQLRLLDDGRVRLGVIATSGAWSAVLSACATGKLAEDSLVVRIESARVGVLPVPAASVLKPVSEKLTDSGGTVSGKTISLPNDWVWPNGKPRFRIRRLEVSDGVARVSFEPTGRGR